MIGSEGAPDAGDRASGPPPDGAAGTDVELRLSALEYRLDALEYQVRHLAGVAESAYHLVNIVDPRTLVLTAQVAEVRRTVHELRDFAADLQRMAAAVWDETAVTRRIARLEDLLLDAEGGAAGTRSVPGGIEPE